jgi:hypothetical protein
MSFIIVAGLVVIALLNIAVGVFFILKGTMADFVPVAIVLNFLIASMLALYARDNDVREEE